MSTAFRHVGYGNRFEWIGAVVRNGRIYLRRIEWEAFVERHPRLIEEWHDLHVYLQARYVGQ